MIVLVYPNFCHIMYVHIQYLAIIFLAFRHMSEGLAHKKRPISFDYTMIYFEMR